ncbi:MAG: quinone oxidoreductase [Sphingomonas sp.]
MANAMARVILLSETGGPEKLVMTQAEVGTPRAGEIRLRQTAIGVNYHDIYVRNGLYRTLALPGVPGIEAVGFVEEVGEGVEGLSVGDRVGYVSGGYGAYADQRILPAALALKIPDWMSDVQAAATLMKSLTACALLRRVHKVTAGQTVLIHAAAGGMGQLLGRWASALGAIVIGTVGSEAKAGVARGAGANHVILYREDDTAKLARELTGGHGVDVVFDAVGADTFQSSLDSLGFCGHLVNFGQASGPVAPVSLQTLAARSLTLSRPIIFHYIRTAQLLREMAQETFAAFDVGSIKPIDPIVLSMGQAPQAHLMLEQRQSPGGIVLVP